MDIIDPPQKFHRTLFGLSGFRATRFSNYVSQIPMCIVASTCRSDKSMPEHIQSMLSGHVTDSHGQWAKCLIGQRLPATPVFIIFMDDTKMKWVRDWSHIVHRPRLMAICRCHAQLEMVYAIVSNVFHFSLKSFCLLHNHHDSISVRSFVILLFKSSGKNRKMYIVYIYIIYTLLVQGPMRKVTFHMLKNRSNWYTIWIESVLVIFYCESC